jgi:hypothetical protein
MAYLSDLVSYIQFMQSYTEKMAIAMPQSQSYST